MALRPWQVTFKIFRQKNGEKPHYDPFVQEVDPDESVLEVIERIWAFKDRSLTYRHACHHSACGACGMRVNGSEKLTCITPVRAVTRQGGTVVVEPLRNFAVVSDLVVNMSPFYQAMERVHYASIIPVAGAPLQHGIRPEKGRSSEVEAGLLRLSDCLECGLCVSACPTALTSRDYLGPAVMAAIQVQKGQLTSDLVKTADSHQGVWGCHSAYECTAVCPSFVEPAWRIMDLRGELIKRGLAGLFHRREAAE